MSTLVRVDMMQKRCLRLGAWRSVHVVCIVPLGCAEPLLKFSDASILSATGLMRYAFSIEPQTVIVANQSSSAAFPLLVKRPARPAVHLCCRTRPEPGLSMAKDQLQKHENCQWVLHQHWLKAIVRT